MLLLVTAFFLISPTYAAEFVGAKQCQSCHQAQYQAWQGSHHERSMDHASDQSVLGDFNDVSLDFDGKRNRFYKQGDQFWVNIEGPDGAFHDYQITYTFAYTPLQQYMVEFDDGRVQLIPFAWDSRSQSEGGQRWFHLYPEATENHQQFYWTNSGQNWNYMCADCHSTHVKRNFDLASNSYQTGFSEINVGCEACHGPASDHISWSKAANSNDPQMGFTRTLDKTVTQWNLAEGDTTLSPESIAPSEQSLVCAQCHSRHVQISEADHVASKALGDRYLMSRISANLYYPDGQIYDEVFTYGSFLQSKMQRSGVVCSNCHDPHSAQLTVPEKEVCLQCHLANSYANPNHHNHPADSSGAQCVNCHMPATTYMQVDDRRDHGWHIPRPDLSRTLGTKDACLSCHQDKDSQWSDQVTQGWFPASTIRAEKHFAPVFAAADQGYYAVASALSHIAQNGANAPIIRASALDRMAPFTDTNTVIAIARGSKHKDSNVRIGAINGSQGIKGAERWRIVAPLLADPVLAVRTEAALALAPLWQQLSTQQRQQLQPALDDYLAIQAFNADRGFAHSNRGNVYAYQGQTEAAIDAYTTGIRIEPNYAVTYTNLAELYRRQDKNPLSLEILLQGLQANPDDGNIPYYLGLAYLRAKQTPQARRYLQTATLNSPDNAQFHYVYGLSLQSDQPGQAQKALRTAYTLGSNPEHLFALCELQISQRAFQAGQCIQELSKQAPENIIAELKSRLKQRSQ